MVVGRGHGRAGRASPGWVRAKWRNTPRFPLVGAGQLIRELQHIEMGCGDKVTLRVLWSALVRSKGLEKKITLTSQRDVTADAQEQWAELTYGKD